MREIYVLTTYDLNKGNVKTINTLIFQSAYLT
jgi:hypothetical protein